jgi:predicted nucleotidyltransferase
VVVRRGIERGDFRAGVDVDVVVDAFTSPTFYRFLVTNAPLDAAFVASVVDTTMRAFGA